MIFDLPQGAIVLALALAFDLALGEPPASLHPVVWIGRLVAFFERAAPSSAMAQLIYGGGVLVLVSGAIAVPAYLILLWTADANGVVHALAGAFLLKSCFSVNELRRAALRVKNSLLQRQMDAARLYLGHLVSRDTSSLDEQHVVAATVESVSENVTDSFVAPILFYLVLGVPGALLYRTVNTFDAMIGYRGKYEYLGKIPARVDDIANYIPARLAAALTVLASWLTGNDSRRAWATMLRDHALTASPNAGWTMSAMAGALNVRLVKVGHYSLGDPGSPLSAQKIDRAIQVTLVVVLIMAVLAISIEVFRHARFS